jgi:broad specificity phosphatase PhoE
LQRAHETARIVAERHDCSVQADPRLREISFGRWEGRTRSLAFSIRRSRHGLIILRQLIGAAAEVR